MRLDIDAIRADFPALKSGHIFFDGPGGTQVPRQTMDAMVDYLITSNANLHGPFLTSRLTDQRTAEARDAMADFLNADSSQEIVFGPNMTTLTFGLSRAMGRSLSPGDEIIVSRLDHDANIAPWVALEECGAVIRWIDFHPEDCTLDMATFESALNSKTKIVAVGYSSNLLGTINDVSKITSMAHDVGAQVFIDAVNAAPHIPMDVQALDCDFLVCSAYKFFGPHLGILFGKYALLDSLSAYKVRPAGDLPPDKWETGTQNFEGQAGLVATINYLSAVGEKYGRPFEADYPQFSGRRRHLKTAMAVMEAYENELFAKLLEDAGNISGLKIYGLTDPAKLNQRVPTLAFRITGHSPQQITQMLANKNIYAWDGDCYAVEPVKRLGLTQDGGVVRVGLSVYNTMEEVAQLVGVLKEIAER